MEIPKAFVLLKNFSKNGLVKFHGVVSSESEAQAWQNGGPSNWYYEYEAEFGSVCASKPITYDRMSNGEIE